MSETEFTTVVFDLDVKSLAVNPFYIKSNFGNVLAVSIGNEIKRADDLESINTELYDLLGEAALQIEYLQEKFQETGSGNAMLSKIKTLQSKARGEQS